MAKAEEERKDEDAGEGPAEKGGAQVLWVRAQERRRRGSGEIECEDGVVGTESGDYVFEKESNEVSRAGLPFIDIGRVGDVWVGLLEGELGY